MALSGAQLQQLWIGAGGPADEAEVAAAIALAESGGNSDARNNNPPVEDSRGLWQINVLAHPWAAAQNMYNPSTNAAAAVRVYQGRSSTFNAWSTYTSGAYLAYMGSGSRDRPGGGEAGDDDGGGIGLGDIATGALLLNPFGGGALLSPILGGGLLGKLPVIGGLFTFAKKLTLAVEEFLGAIVWLFDPFNWLRMVEFLFGFILFMAGIAALGKALTRPSSAAGQVSRELGNVTAAVPAVVGGAPGAALKAGKRRKRAKVRRAARATKPAGRRFLTQRQLDYRQRRAREG